MKWLLASDLHLTDRPRDAYRFGLFKWLASRQREHNVDATFILGDLTDRKDNHSATLVNQLVDNLLLLDPPIYILRGNHDCIDPANPFFRFLQCVDGVDFIVDPLMHKKLGVAFLPHQRTQRDLDRACEIIKPGCVVMAHATFDGSRSETGTLLSGLSLSAIESKHPRLVYSGDVHVPQVLKSVRYVGSPYHIRFGDDFMPRVILLDDFKEQNLHYPCLRKWSLRINEADQLYKHQGLEPGDQVKITVMLTREEVTEWATHKAKILAVTKELKLDVFGLNLEVQNSKPERQQVPGKMLLPKEVFETYCKGENVAQNIKQVGLELLDG